MDGSSGRHYFQSFPECKNFLAASKGAGVKGKELTIIILFYVFYFKSKVEMLSVKLKCMDCVDKRVLSG